jgi:hypothetical protein
MEATLQPIDGSFTYDFNNKDLFKLESHTEYYEYDFKIVEEFYTDIARNKKVKRLIKYKLFKKGDLTRKQVENVKERLKWKPFVDNSKCKPLQTEDVFMEYNPEMLLSSKSQAFIQKLEEDKNNGLKVEEVHTNNMLSSKNMDFMKQSIGTNSSSSKLNKNIIEQSTIVNTSQKESERKKVFNQNMGAFIPKFKTGDTTNTNSYGDNTNNEKKNENGHNNKKTIGKFVISSKRGKIDNTEGNQQYNRNEKNAHNKDTRDNFSIKVLNIVEDVNDDYVHDWLYNLNIGIETHKIKYKLHIPKKKSTGVSKDFMFINFHNKHDTNYMYECLQNSKMGYQIIKCSYAHNK